MDTGPGRRLLWFPIVHTQADLGSLGQSIQALHVRKTGRGQWEEHRRQVDRVWQAVRGQLDRLALDYSRVRLYQDGLPTCGKEEEIVRDLARSGSRNHQLLLELMARGARLTGTESPPLLVEEYALARQLLDGLANEAPEEFVRGQHERARSLLERRDAFVAERIGQTLEPGETGLIFLGMLHSLEGRCAPDVEVIRLDPSASTAPLGSGPQPGQGREKV
jgi:hypothetical protein